MPPGDRGSRGVVHFAKQNQILPQLFPQAVETYCFKNKQLYFLYWFLKNVMSGISAYIEWCKLLCFLLDNNVKYL